MLLDKATFEKKVIRSQSVPPVQNSSSYEKPTRTVVSDEVVSESGKTSRDLKIERLRKAEIARRAGKREKQVMDQCNETSEMKRSLRAGVRHSRPEQRDLTSSLSPTTTDGSSETSCVTVDTASISKYGVAYTVAYIVARWRRRHRIGASTSSSSSPDPGRANSSNFLALPSTPTRPRSCSGASRISLTLSIRSTGSLVAPL